MGCPHNVYNWYGLPQRTRPHHLQRHESSDRGTSRFLLTKTRGHGLTEQEKITIFTTSRMVESHRISRHHMIKYALECSTTMHADVLIATTVQVHTNTC